MAIKPDFAEAWTEMGLACLACGRPYRAIEAFSTSVQLRPNDAQAHDDLARAFFEAGCIEQAAEESRKAVELDDPLGTRRSSLLNVLQCLPDADPDAIFSEHMKWAALHADPMAQFIRAHDNTPDTDRPLKIGYVSADFRQHSVATFIEAVFAHYDRSQFQLICYSDVRKPDEVTERLKHHAQHWRDLQAMPDEQLAELIRQDRIDILVDLAGHTSWNRLRTFACKPAPVQVTWLGYFATTGLRTMDWRLTDEHLDPPGQSERWHTERLWRLSKIFSCYTPPNPCPPVSPLPAEKNGFVTFGCFAKQRKLNQQMMSLWADILHAVPNSRLMLLSPGLQETKGKSRLAEFFQHHGIAADRLLFEGPQSFFRWLELHEQVDLMLDTFPFNGHTTTCHSLWMGVPVVTLAGNRCMSRMGLSIMQNLDLPEFVGHDSQQYIQAAVRATGDVRQLAELRATMRDRMRRSPIMNGPQFVADLERAYRSMWRQWCSVTRR